MGHVKIITDSAAELSPEAVEQLGITVVPLQIRLGDETVADESSLRSPDFHKRVARSKAMPVVLAPTARDFAAVYGQLAKEADEIVAIHVSARLNQTFQASLAGRNAYLGRCQIAVIDSQLISRAQGILVEEAARAACSGAAAGEIVRLVRGLIPRIYLVLYVENLEYVRQSGLVSAQRAGVAGAGGFKPLFIFEEGELTTVQRTRSRGSPPERLAEFVAEFSELRELTILRSGAHASLAEFRTRLQELFPQQTLRDHVYGPALSAYVGPGALGVVAFER